MGCSGPDDQFATVADNRHLLQRDQGEHQALETYFKASQKIWMSKKIYHFHDLDICRYL